MNGKPLVLFATINTSDYKEILLRRLFHGKGGTYLINNNGSVLIDSFDDITENNINLYDYMKTKYSLTDEDSLSKLEQMKNSIKEKQVGTFDISLNKNIHFIHYERLQANDWYVVSIAPDDTIAKELTEFLVLALAVCLGVTFAILGICIYIDLSTQKKNQKLYKVAYIDPVTDIGNEAYFKEKASQFLQNNLKTKYIIALDINKFKALNNIYGYEFCNKILKSLGEKLNTILPKNNITCRISNDVFATIFSYEKNIKTLLDKIFPSFL